MHCKLNSTLKKAIALTLASVILCSFSACKNGGDTSGYDHSTILMGTVITEKVYITGKDTSSDVFSGIDSLIDSLEKNNLSWRIEGSDICNINAAAGKQLENSSFSGSQVSAVTADCIRRAISIGEDSDGALDISIGSVSHLWNFEADEKAHTPPATTDVQKNLPFVDFRNIRIDDNNVILTGSGQELDLGAVGKGLACDEVAKYLSEKSEVSAAVISVGGSILLYGKNPERSDGTFNVAVRDPFGETNDYMGIINLPGGYCISTSGDYEKTFTCEGKTYHHILNPKTGYPAESNITGVTVVSKSGIDTDALSTAAFILGYGEKALELLEKYDAEAVFITHDKKVYVTDGLKDKFTLPESASDFTIAG